MTVSISKSVYIMSLIESVRSCEQRVTMTVSHEEWLGKVAY